MMLHKELTEQIIGRAYAVNNSRGTGFLEKVYEQALMLELEASGLNLEKIQNMTTPAGKTLKFIRMSKSFRVVIKINSDFIRFVSLHPDHDSAYT